MKKKVKIKGLSRDETVEGLRKVMFNSSVSVVEMVGFLELLKFELMASIQITAQRMKPT